jgi:hypothetical protein
MTRKRDCLFNSPAIKLLYKQKASNFKNAAFSYTSLIGVFFLITGNELNSVVGEGIAQGGANTNSDLKCIENRVQMDRVGMMQQPGMMPAPVE